MSADVLQLRWDVDPNVSGVSDIFRWQIDEAFITVGAGAVDSVNGQTGIVVLNAADIPVTPFGSISATDVQAALEEIVAEEVGAVSSVNGQTGAVVLDAADVGALDLTGGTLTGPLEIDVASSSFADILLKLQPNVVPLTYTADGTLTVGNSAAANTAINDEGFELNSSAGDTHIAMTPGEFDFTGPAAGVWKWLWINRFGESGFRQTFDVDGKISWGDGTNATDTDLERSAPGELSINGDPIATAEVVAFKLRRRVLTMRALWAKLGGTTPAIVQWEGGSNVQGVGGGLTGTGSMVDRTRYGFADWLGRNDPGLGWVPAFSYTALVTGNYIFRYGLGFVTASSGAAPAGCTPRTDCGLGGWALEVASGSGTPVHTQVGARYAKVYLTAKKTNGGSAQLFVDGVAYGSPISTTDGSITGSTSSGKITITWTGAGTTFEVRVTGGNSAIVDGIDFDTATAPAVQHMNGGHAGADVDNFLAAGSYPGNAQHSTNNPADLYVGSFGLNWYWNHVSPDPAAMLVDVKAWIDARHADSPQAGFLLDRQWYGGSAANSKVPPSLSDWLTIWHGVIDDAIAYCDGLGIGADTFDTYELWGDLYDPQPTPADPNSLLAADLLHPNTRAYKGAGWLLAGMMLPGESPGTLGATATHIPNAAGTYDLAITTRAPTDGVMASYRDGGNVTPGLLRTIWEWLDSSGNQITGIRNDGGQFWTDGLSFLKGSAIHAQTAYWPQFRMTFADQVNKRGPIFALSYVGAGGGTFTNLGDTITIDAGKETYFRLDDSDRVRFSKPILVGVESGAPALVPALMGPGAGPSLESGFAVGIFGDMRWYRAAIGNGAGAVTDSAVEMKNATTYIDAAPYKTVPVKAATTGNITLSNNQTIDGVAVANPDRVLVKDQSSPANNGIYTVVDAGAWTRTVDCDTAAEASTATVAVQRGTLNGGTVWSNSFTAGSTLGTTAMTWGRIIKSTEFNAKGDLLSASADDTPVILPVGTTARSLLTVDSTTTTGLAWEAPPIFKRKTGATSRTSTSPSSDPDLTTPDLVVSAVYRFQAHLIHQGLATDDISIQVAMPTGAVIEAVAQFPPTNVAAVPWATNSRRLVAAGSAFSSGLVDASTPTATLITGIVVMSTNTGTFAIQWSATANTGTNVTLLANSWMLLERVA